ncbi:hypothetical protein LCGC14_0603120 [marine sediment metagenome]|uniref:Uncharacterized protein n=1 Tax=marine sediment metagenome TaxID=412755 RepID=A0A0F9RTZ8_9ZZZZ
MIKINYKTHGRNLCLDCSEAFQFSPKNRTCLCGIDENRTKCATECDFYNFIVKVIYTECGVRV